MSDLRAYECMVIVDRDHENPDEELASIGRLIESQGGQVEEASVWRRRRLAYPIRDKFEGVYLLVLFQASGQALNELRHSFRLNESVLRYLIQRRA